MTQDWKPTLIGNICKTNQQTYSLSEKWPFVNYLDTGNITENHISEIQHLVTGQDTLPSRARRKVAIDDILYSTVRPNQRHYGIVKEVVPNMLVSTGFTVITVDKVKADADFLYYYLSQKNIIEGLHAIGEQSVSAYPSIKPSDIECLELLLPSLPEQIKIGCTLRILDDKIANNTKVNHHLAEIAQAIFKSWFVKFEPWEGEMPENWTYTTLDSMCSLISKGITPKYDETSAEIVINQKCIRNKEIDLSSARGHQPKRINEKWLQYGDVLINSTGEGTLGRVAQFLFDGSNYTVDSHITIVRSSSDELVHFIGQWCLLRESEFASMASGSTGQTDLPRERLKAMECILPDIKTLENYSLIVKPIVDKQVAYQMENARLVDIRDAILPRLMSGELSVSDISEAK